MLLVDGSCTGISSVATTRDAITIATATKIQRRRENYRGSIKEYWRLEYRRQNARRLFFLRFRDSRVREHSPKTKSRIDRKGRERERERRNGWVREGEKNNIVDLTRRVRFILIHLISPDRTNIGARKRRSARARSTACERRDGMDGWNGTRQGETHGQQHFFMEQYLRGARYNGARPTVYRYCASNVFRITLSCPRPAALSHIYLRRRVAVENFRRSDHV